VVVGGALLAWQGLRDATSYVDSAERLDEEFCTAVEEVAFRHGLAPRWVNAAAAGFLPIGFDPMGGEVILDHPKLVVRGASLDEVLLMKIFAGRAADTDDIRRLWAMTTFTTTAELVDRYRSAYPHEPEDSNLGSWLEGILRS
jgi:hypothetical protein